MGPTQPKSTHLESIETSEKPVLLKKRTIIKEAFCETFEGSTLHALPNMIRNEYFFMKCFWTLLFIGGVSASIYCKYTELLHFVFSSLFVSYF